MRVFNNGSIAGDIISKNAGKNDIDETGFYQIMAAQLRNQDPSNPGDSTQYIAQMAQFTVLQEMVSMKTAMDKVLLSQKFMQGSVMIGSTVKIPDETKKTDNNSSSAPTYITGKVTAVKVSGNNVNVVVGGKEYSIDKVQEVSAGTNEAVAGADGNNTVQSGTNTGESGSNVVQNN